MKKHSRKSSMQDTELLFYKHEAQRHLDAQVTPPSSPKKPLIVEATAKKKQERKDKVSNNTLSGYVMR